MTVTFNVRISKDAITPSLKRKQKLLAQVPKRAFVEWQQHTPIRTGNARRSTRLRKQTIVAQYPYAERLDKGYSNQAPDGMSKPVLAFLKNLLNKLLRTK